MSLVNHSSSEGRVKDNLNMTPQEIKWPPYMHWHSDGGRSTGKTEEEMQGSATAEQGKQCSSLSQVWVLLTEGIVRRRLTSWLVWFFSYCSSFTVL